ncbi:hypothetical protein Dtox_1217 [Desulfofarcimen acetoxidans DSM 771]|jgi:hypothetical protein|uniref:Uncharacterized protein n=1 Tax=Desulfofarcimen acetoxidans (strain ATCC 49208 / DSM 771 / KCTC 5769 / VKM B-1644 / 5575) TaxID=485916 RepID=C8W5B9_DESAS|nr:hypothetical protein [Desulfofarcimen acetoxidans]ACV62101.1 hypothetical protein Dtox_1217 [Desulfofarcimen acetoxidans DSM 771]
MKYILIILLLGGLAGAGLMLWLGIKNAQRPTAKQSGEDNDG